MKQRQYYPNWREIVVYSETQPKPHVLVETDKYKAVIGGLEPGGKMPAHPEGPAIFHFLEGTGRIAVGEETGNLDEMLNKISDFYEVSIEYSVKRLTSLLEPIFLVVMGAVVGFVVASLILPMFDMMKAIRR